MGTKGFYPNGELASSIGRPVAGTTRQGVPVAGGDAAGLLRESELSLAPTRHAFHAELFDLADENARQKYHDVMERCANGLYKIIHMTRQPAAESGWPTVYLEYTISFKDTTQALKAVI